jgi:hypothetical protein
MYCALCGELMGLPAACKASAPYRMAAADLAKKHGLAQVQRRLINKKLKKIDDQIGMVRMQKENVFTSAMREHSSIPEGEILSALRRI